MHRLCRTCLYGRSDPIRQTSACLSQPGSHSCRTAASQQIGPSIQQGSPMSGCSCSFLSVPQGSYSISFHQHESSSVAFQAAEQQRQLLVNLH